MADRIHRADNDSSKLFKIITELVYISSGKTDDVPCQETCNDLQSFFRNKVQDIRESIPNNLPPTVVELGNCGEITTSGPTFFSLRPVTPSEVETNIQLLNHSFYLGDACPGAFIKTHAAMYVTDLCSHQLLPSERRSSIKVQARICNTSIEKTRIGPYCLELL